MTNDWGGHFFQCVCLKQCWWLRNVNGEFICSERFAWGDLSEVRHLSLDSFPFGQNYPILLGHWTRTNPAFHELFSTEHLATWLAFLFSQELPWHSSICIMLAWMNILCLECSQAWDFVAHYPQAGWGLGSTFGRPLDSFSAKWTFPPAALWSPLVNWDEVTSGDGKSQEGGHIPFPRLPDEAPVVPRPSLNSLCLVKL